MFIQSRDLRPLDRYFPEIHEAAIGQLPAGSVIDGEIVIARGDALDFDALQMRLHPAASRVARLSKEIPAAFVGFDLLAAGGRDLRDTPQHRTPSRAGTIALEDSSADPSDPGHSRSRARRGLAGAV